ncbi:MAG: hypothetical protein J7604_22940 [Sporocytophaga sp.]|uniref:hypothetical protein n=1 Tax=Sporocytophaga sp. TaxID=2231183 RepID=UPI001AFDBABE|nr:hypothetical protein [Sporocytophaga sp.]MBO9703088.1 hypothetical protein [Sporocytophaga sp.]
MKWLFGLIAFLGISVFSYGQGEAAKESEEDVSISCAWVDNENIVCFAVPEGEGGATDSLNQDGVEVEEEIIPKETPIPNSNSKRDDGGSNSNVVVEKRKIRL